MANRQIGENEKIFIDVDEAKKLKNYTIMSNFHFRDPRKIGLKAMGLMSFMISLPKNWVYSIEGLAKCTGESKDSIRNTIKKLEEYGYLTREQKRDENGCFTSCNYILYLEPKIEPICDRDNDAQKTFVQNNENCNKNSKFENGHVQNDGKSVQKCCSALENIDILPSSGFPTTDLPTSGFPTQINTKEIITKGIKEKEIYKEKEFPSFSLCVFDSEFSKFWAEYPRKEKKDRTKRAFLKKRKAGVEFEPILDGLKRYKQKWAQENTKLKYIPHPASWINDERWNDEIVISENESKPSYNIDEYVETMDTFAVAPTYSAQIKRKQEEQNRDLAELERIKKQEKDIWIKDFGTRRSKFLLNAKTLKQLEHDKKQLTRMKENKDFVWVEEKGDYFYQFEIEKMKNENLEKIENKKISFKTS